MCTCMLEIVKMIITARRVLYKSALQSFVIKTFLISLQIPKEYESFRAIDMVYQTENFYYV